MLTIRAAWQSKCARHPRFDPRQGEGAIKAGCVDCYRLICDYGTITATIRQLGGTILLPERITKKGKKL